MKYHLKKTAVLDNINQEYKDEQYRSRIQRWTISIKNTKMNNINQEYEDEFMVLENFNARPLLSKPPPSPPTLGRGNCHSEPGRSRNTFAERSRNTFQNGQQILFITWVRKYFSEMLRNGIYIRLFKNPVTANQSAVCSARIQKVPTIPFNFIFIYSLTQYN